MRWYFYLGIALIAFVEINFFAVIQPFALWYLPMAWYGYILFVDGLVFKLKKKSLISTYPREFLLLVVLSVPFWLIFEAYNLFDLSWYYTHFSIVMHLTDFTTILPALMETFSLVNASGVGKRLDSRKTEKRHAGITTNNPFYRNVIKLLVLAGLLVFLVPFLVPSIGFLFMWIGLFLLIDPLNYLYGKSSVIQKVSSGQRSVILRLFLSGLIMGLTWEFWNYQAYPKWIYAFSLLLSSYKLFEMPLLGYIGYLPFAMEAFVFYALFRSFLFKKGNELLSM